jgi:hypothetical protein
MNYIGVDKLMENDGYEINNDDDVEDDHVSTFKSFLDTRFPELDDKPAAPKPAPIDNDDEDEEDEPPKQVVIDKRPLMKSSLKHVISEEHQKQEILDSIIGESKQDEFNLEREKEIDEKMMLLEHIDTYIEILKDDGVDTTRYEHKVNEHSPFEDVSNLHKILRLKTDRNSYSTIGEEYALIAAKGFAFIFDGRKEYLGRRPNAKSWVPAVSAKMRRMRPKTSELVGELLRNIGPGTQMLIELAPSLIYSLLSNDETDKGDVITHDEILQATKKINSIQQTPE